MPARHRELADLLRRRILAGELMVGQPMPSEAELGRTHGLSRGTVRQALAALRSEGLISGGRGAPPVVRSDVAAQPLDTLQSFSAWAGRAGMAPGQRTVEVARRVPGPEPADDLHLGPDEVAVEVLRLRLLDGRPVMVERSTFVDDVGRHLLLTDLDDGSIVSHLATCGVVLAAARHVIDAVAADDVDADLLGVAPGSPLLRERRLTTDASGRPVESSDDRYVPGAVAFTISNAAPGAGPVTSAWRRDPMTAPRTRPHARTRTDGSTR